MAYENKAQELIRMWDRAYLLEDIPRDWERIFESDIATCMEDVREDCANVVKKWMATYDEMGEEARSILQMIYDEIQMRGIDGQQLPVLRATTRQTPRSEYFSNTGHW